MKPGLDGEGAFPGDSVEVHYEIRLSSNGLLFDSSRKKGRIFKFRISSEEVVR